MGKHTSHKKQRDEIIPPKKNKFVLFIKAVYRRFYNFAIIVIRALLDFFLSHKAKSMPPISDPILLESATSLAQKIRTQKLTSVQVINSFIRRIKEVNPLLNCVVDERFKDALEDGAQADMLIKSGRYTEKELEEKFPFLGVPFTTKDQLAVKGMIQTAGIYRRRNNRATEDSDVVALMRKSGAIPLALTNVSEVCMWWESVNTVHGRTSNPYNTNRIVGGSSGGEGCLQGCAGSAFGIGSDIGGSIRMPAFFNGIFGHKPSSYIVSIKGQYPDPNSEEQRSFIGIGPMVRHAVDLKPMLKILAGDNAKFLNLDSPVDLKKINVFYQEHDGGGFMVSPVDRDQVMVLRKSVHHLETALNIKPKQVHIDKFRQSGPIWIANMADNSGVDFALQLGNKEVRINPYKELLKWTVGKSKHTLIGLLTCIAEDNSVQHGSEQHQYLVKKRDDLKAEMQKMLGDNGVFLYPTHPTPAPYHNEPIVRTFNFTYTAIINVLGFPATTVPLGIGREGLPLGLQVIANVNQDRLCLAVAEELERGLGGWVPPEILC
ncbi:unnamed protein product [Hermetia illucens]|uniref:Amidase domain-containing protein n=1 Tax=Hermetia illucens TaxID=343691 RepID=A0A7R8UWJ5_HERIL|nr:fatty-acid amide hydrolase 2-like [Hermetia illucens]CAD7088420.1 unnamed protein product [Hermetia illucens]